MRQPRRDPGGSLVLALALRGGGWGAVAGAACGALAAVALGGFGRGVPGPAVLLLVAAPYGAAVGLVVGLALGAPAGGLLGWWTAAHPRPQPARAAYRRRATPVVGLLLGAAVALALEPALLRWGARPFGMSTTHFVLGYTVAAAFVAVEAGLAGGWATCRLLGWYAAQPE
jgi:hypothetical protein